jgi:hypothetical protein
MDPFRVHFDRIETEAEFIRIVTKHLPFRPGLWLSFYEAERCVGRILITAGDFSSSCELSPHLRSGTDISIEDVRLLLPDEKHLNWHAHDEGRGSVKGTREGRGAVPIDRSIAIRFFTHWDDGDDDNKICEAIWGSQQRQGGRGSFLSAVTRRP